MCFFFPHLIHMFFSTAPPTCFSSYIFFPYPALIHSISYILASFNTNQGITPGAIAIVDACASELLGRFFTAASLCAAPAAPGVRAFQSAVQLCLPRNSKSSSSSTAQDQGESTASSSSLAMKALAGFDAAVRRLRDAKKEGSLNFINSSSDGKCCRVGDYLCVLSLHT
jgi:hypothetical protein